MKPGMTISSVGHAAALFFGFMAISAQPMEAPQVQALPPGDLRVLGAAYEPALQEQAVRSSRSRPRSKPSRRENILCPVYRRSSWISGRTMTWSARS